MQPGFSPRDGPPRLVCESLEAGGAIHGFFGRRGGVSTGDFESLNAGAFSGDAATSVAANRALCARTLGVPPERLLTVRQIHSPRVVIVEHPFGAEGPPEADALVTNRPGLAIGALAADCIPVLFLDPGAQVVGAAHAGWRGALAGALEATIDALTTLGGRPEAIIAAIGPCLRRPNFQVGLDLLEAFTAKYPEADQFFHPDPRADKRRLDLAGFAAARMAARGVTRIVDSQVCTLADPAAYFSYRAQRAAGREGYGRNLSAICLPA